MCLVLSLWLKRKLLNALEVRVFGLKWRGGMEKISNLILRLGPIVVSTASQCPTPVLPVSQSRSEFDIQVSRGEGLAFAVELSSVDEVGARHERRRGGLA